MRANSTALSTMPAGVSPKRFMMRSESEPWLVPMRMAMPRALQSSTSGLKVSSMRASSSSYWSSVYSRMANFFLSAKLPGLTRTFSTHCAASMAASGLKWMSATMGTSQPAASELGLDVLEIGGVLHRRRGDADDFAADLDEVEGLLHALARVHRVAGEHRLDADGIGPADADLADLDLAGMAALVVVRIMAIGDGAGHGSPTLEANARLGKPGMGTTLSYSKSFNLARR